MLHGDEHSDIAEKGDRRCLQAENDLPSVERSSEILDGHKLRMALYRELGDPDSESETGSDTSTFLKKSLHNF
jgi:hypothetical protein